MLTSSEDGWSHKSLYNQQYGDRYWSKPALFEELISVEPGQVAAFAAQISDLFPYGQTATTLRSMVLKEQELGSWLPVPIPRLVAMEVRQAVGACWHLLMGYRWIWAYTLTLGKWTTVSSKGLRDKGTLSNDFSRPLISDRWIIFNILLWVIYRCHPPLPSPLLTALQCTGFPSLSQKPQANLGTCCFLPEVLSLHTCPVGFLLFSFPFQNPCCVRGTVLRLYIYSLI